MHWYTYENLGIVTFGQGVTTPPAHLVFIIILCTCVNENTKHMSYVWKCVTFTCVYVCLYTHVYVCVCVYVCTCIINTSCTHVWCRCSNAPPRPKFFGRTKINVEWFDVGLKRTKNREFGLRHHHFCAKFRTFITRSKALRGAMYMIYMLWYVRDATCESIRVRAMILATLDVFRRCVRNFGL